MGCSRSHIYESFNLEDSGITPAEEYLETARMLRILGEYFEGGGHGYPIDPNHCKNCFDIYDSLKDIEKSDK